MFKRKKPLLLLISIFIIFFFIGCTAERGTIEETTQNNLERSGAKEISTSTDYLEVHYLDVGQGDSTLIMLPDGQTILIDAGCNSAGKGVVDYLKKLDIKLVDHVIGTHPHEDHIGGLDVVINSFNIGKVYLPKVSHTSKSFEDLLLAIKNKGLKVTEAKGGIALNIGDRATAVFVAPNSSNYPDLNNYSAVVKLIYGDNSFLFTGDAEEKSEGEILLQSRTQLKIDILKVGHHGSSTSTSQPFLDIVAPKYAVISVGKENDYGHPHQEIIKRLEEKGVQYFRTDLQGPIIVQSNGKDISFNVAGIEEKSIEEKIPKDIRIISIDLKEELVEIKNIGNNEVDMGGWRLVSAKGNDEFLFPENFILKSAQAIKIASGPAASEKENAIVWTNKNIWNNDGDPGVLYDALGRVVSSLP
ncbi:MAG: hypothetical protein VR72_02270 [Clostridiaceae bacterium BRH_c20a]|nr:MAG: hypothetical protein VR72_02270 [Clostridiaceae bacterium BRH_c20a]